MASPQTEQGYTRIANELLDALVASGLGKREITIVLAVLRKTYGYNKKDDTISNGQLAKATGLARQNVSRTVSDLIERHVLTCEESEVVAHGQRLNRLGINKNYEEWLTGDNSAPVPKQDGCQNDTSDNSAPVPNRFDNPHQNDSPTGAKLMHTKDRKDRERQYSVHSAESTDAYPPEFEQVWKLYPRRHRANPKKPAYKAWKARLRAGHSADAIEAGVKRYAEAVEADGKVGTQYVMQAATFFGPNELFLEPWVDEGGINDEFEVAL